MMRGVIAIATAAIYLFATEVAESQSTDHQAFRAQNNAEGTLNNCSLRARSSSNSTANGSSFRVGPCNTLTADIVWPPESSFNQSFDNLRFRAEIKNHTASDSVTMQIYADNLLVGSQTVSTPGPEREGELHTRTYWPFPGPAEVNLRYVTPGGLVDAAGNSALLGQGLHPNVKVHNLRFWNLSDPSGQTNVTAGLARTVADLLTTPIPTNASDTIDGVYGQCPALTKTQWRYNGIGTLNLSNSCADMAALSGCTPQACIDEIWTTIQDDPNNVHVAFVETLGCGWSGAHWEQAGGKYLIIVTEGSTATPEFFTRLLAHELGHAYVGGHVTPACPGAGCCANLQQVNRRLMCSNPGRLMTAGDCASAQNSTQYVNNN